MDIEPDTKNLYVINHDATNVSENIEVFKVVEDQDGIPTSLEYLKSLKSSELTKKWFGALNSITVINENQYYVTQFVPQPAKPVADENTPSKGSQLLD